LFRRVFFKGDSDVVYGLGDTIYRPRLGRTLSIIAEQGPSAFYNGELSDSICEEIQTHGGIINRKDLEIYHARIKPAISIQLENRYTAYGVPPPASSAITLLILKVMSGKLIGKKQHFKRKYLVGDLGYGLTPQSLDTDKKQVKFYHILTEVFKFAYGKRSALGDEYDSQTDKNQEIERVKKFFLFDFS
jgi:gamma-glutamyltranspeptidase